jgi:hypothetical protein
VTEIYDDPSFDQGHAIAIVDRFRQHDLSALRRLTAEELAEQVQAREALWRYVGDIWDYIKYELRVPDPARNPAYTSVAGLSDLAARLADHAAMVRNEQRDPGN